MSPVEIRIHVRLVSEGEYIYIYVYVLYVLHCSIHIARFHCTVYRTQAQPIAPPEKKINKSLEIFSSKRELYLPDMSSGFLKPCGLLLISPSDSHRAADLHAASAALYLENSWV